MASADAHTLLETAVGAAHAVHEQVLDAFRAGVETSTKAGFQDLVTATDREVEARIADYITARHDDATIVGEEHGARGTGPVRWIVDPIDGTANFASGLPFFSISIAAVSAGRTLAGVVHDPVREETFAAGLEGATLNGRRLRAGQATGEEDAVLLTAFPYHARNTEGLARYGELLDRFRAVRRLGSTALHLAYVAAGRASVTFETSAGAWDIAAGLHLVRQAGGLTWSDSRDGADRHAPNVWRHVACGPAFQLERSMIADILPEVRTDGLKAPGED